MSRTAHHVSHRQRDHDLLGARDRHIVRVSLGSGQVEPCVWPHPHAAAECPGRDYGSRRIPARSVSGHVVVDLRYSAAVMASGDGRPVPRQLTHGFVIYNFDRAYGAPDIGERSRILERRARAQVRTDLRTAIRTANTLLRVAAADEGISDHESIEDPAPYRPRGSAAW